MIRYLSFLGLIVCTGLAISCQTHVNNHAGSGSDHRTQNQDFIPSKVIAPYVTGVYEDSKGHLWFGTISKGIARYDGKVLKYFTREDGLPTDRVIGIQEDANGLYWLNTGEGLVQYNGTKFTTYRISDEDMMSNSVSCLYIDHNGLMWVGTWGGLYLFDEIKFTPFSLPSPNVFTSINPDTKNWITDIKGDAHGNIWMARDGYGVYRYDGASIIHYIYADGLSSNNVTEIEIDQDDHIWLGMRNGNKDWDGIPISPITGGVNQIKDQKILSFSDIATLNDDVYEIFCDISNNLWICTTHNGVFRYDGSDFKHYDIPISIMSMAEDRNGNLWLGGAGGLYRINPKGDIQYIDSNGPWGVP